MNFLIISIVCTPNYTLALTTTITPKTNQEFNADAATIFNIVRWYLKCNVSSIKNKLLKQITFELNRVHGFS